MEYARSTESLISLTEALLIDSFKDATLISERGEWTLVFMLYELTRSKSTSW